MPLNLELNPVYLEAKLPQRDEEGRLVVARAPEITWEWAENHWQRVNEVMEQQEIDRTQCQVVVLTNKGDVTTPFYQSLRHEGLGVFPVATTESRRHSDGEVEFFIQDEAPEAKSIYIVGSLITAEDYLRVRAVADHYRYVLNAQYVTLVSTFTGSGRSDKNVDGEGVYEPKTINLRAEIGALSSFIDRIIGFEPHSSAAQAYAAEFGIPFVSLSPWRYLIDLLKERVKIVPENTVIVRPDIGRKIAATRIREYLKIPSVSFNKKRRGDTGVEIYDLTTEEQKLVKGKVGILYDDEVGSASTLEKIADICQKYGMKGLYVCLVHCKFTEGWRARIEHPLLKIVLGTDSRPSIGDIAKSEKIEVISLVPLLREVIEADIEGVNFWRDERFRDMILQEYPDVIASQGDPYSIGEPLVCNKVAP